MSDFTFTVDTTPMARSVDGVKGHVAGVTAAVTAMEAAVIATEVSASKKICENVDQGFYMLVRSQISQKAVAAYSQMQSKMMTLTQLVKALDGVRRQMESDYNMISRRYAKLFSALNRALETRVRELDRPAMKLAEIRKTYLFDRLKDDSSLVFTSANEINGAAQAAITGGLKQKTLSTLKTLESSVSDSASYSEKLANILETRENGGKDAGENAEHGEKNGKNAEKGSVFYLPAMFFVSESLINSGENVESVYVTQSEARQNSGALSHEINEVSNAASTLKWTDAKNDNRARVRQEFVKMCEAAEKSDDSLPFERVSAEMMRLFDAASPRELAGDGV